MKITKILTVLTLVMLIFSLAACGTTGGGKKNDVNRKSEIAALIATEPKSMDEAAKLHQKLMAQENAILSENSALWEKANLSQFLDFCIQAGQGAVDIALQFCIAVAVIRIQRHIADASGRGSGVQPNGGDQFIGLHLCVDDTCVGISLLKQKHQSADNNQQ